MLLAAVIVSISTSLSYNVVRAQILGTAGTVVESDITTNTTWTKDGSPYIVIKSITIKKGATLTIEPGTEVVFVNNLFLNVEGSLVANGSLDNKVVFRLRNPAVLDSYFSFVLKGGSIILKNTVVDIPYIELRFSSPAKGVFIVENSTIKNLRFWDFTYSKYVNITILNSIVNGSIGRIDFRPQVSNCTINIINSIVVGDFGLASLYGGANISIDGSVFVGRIMLGYGGDNIRANITNSIFVGPELRISTRVGPSALIMRNNSILADRVEFGVYADARYNWWGDPSGPNCVINPGKGVNVYMNPNVVSIYPWLTEPLHRLPPVEISMYPRHSMLNPFISAPFHDKYIPINITVITSEKKSNILLTAVYLYAGWNYEEEYLLWNATSMILEPSLDGYMKLKVAIVTKDLRANANTTYFHVFPWLYKETKLKVLNSIAHDSAYVVTNHDVLVYSSISFYGFNPNSSAGQAVLWFLNNTRIELVFNRSGEDIQGKLVEDRIDINPNPKEYGYVFERMWLYRFVLPDGVYEIRSSIMVPGLNPFNSSLTLYVDTTPPQVKNIEVLGVDKIDSGYKVKLRVDVEDLLKPIYMNLTAGDRRYSLYLYNDTNIVTLTLPGGVDRYSATIVFRDSVGHETTYTITIPIPTETTTTTTMATETTPQTKSVTTPTIQTSVSSTPPTIQSPTTIVQTSTPTPMLPTETMLTATSPTATQVATQSAQTAAGIQMNTTLVIIGVVAIAAIAIATLVLKKRLIRRARELHTT